MNVQQLLKRAVLLLLIFTGCKSAPKDPVWPPPVALSAQSLPLGFKNGKVTIRAVHGDVAGWDGERWIRSKPREVVAWHGIIRTGKKSWIYMSVNGVTAAMRLGPESEIGFDSIIYRRKDGSKADTQSVLLLRRGMMVASVKKLSTNSIFLVRAPDVVVNVRGTDFTVCSRGKVASWAGEVAVMSGGQPYLLHDNEYFNPEAKAVFKIDGSLLKKINGQDEGYHLMSSPLTYFSSPFERGLDKARATLNGQSVLPSPPDEQVICRHPFPAFWEFDFCQ